MPLENDTSSSCAGAVSIFNVIQTPSSEPAVYMKGQDFHKGINTS